MEQSLTTWLIPALTLFGGAAIGFLIARLLSNHAPGNTQQQLDELQERFNNYQSEVVTHFNTSATLVKRLSQSYQDVQEHLALGADRLSLDELSRQRLLDALQQDSVQLGARERLTPPLSTEPPRDYAPKVEDQPGTLAESYGMKSKKLG